MAYGEEATIDDLSIELKSQLELYLGETIETSINQVIRDLLDRHGTGRVLFRNTRAAIQGFPERQVLCLSLRVSYHLFFIRRAERPEETLS